MAGLSDEQAQAALLKIDSYATKLVKRSESENGFALASNSELGLDDVRCRLYHVSHVVRTSLSAAVDHLHAMCVQVLRTGVLHLYAPASLARGALECASTAIWLVRPDASDERITRALKWNVADVRDGDRAFRDAGLPVPTPLQARLDKIEVVATRCGLAFKPISGGYRSSDAVKEAQSLLDRSPYGVLMPWQLASGNAHGRRWSTMAFADTMQRQPTSDPTSRASESRTTGTGWRSSAWQLPRP